MDWFVWIMFGMALLLAVARMLIGPSDSLPGGESDSGVDDDGPHELPPG